MKHINILFPIVSILFLVVLGCSSSNMTGPFNSDAKSTPTDQPVNEIRFLRFINPVTYPIRTDKGSKVGELVVTNDERFIYVTFMMESNWKIEETNVHLAKDINHVPAASDWYPIVDLFDYTTSHRGDISTFEYQIPITESDIEHQAEIIIAANAVVFNQPSPLASGLMINVWGGDKIVNGPEPWYVGVYNIRSTNVPIPPRLENQIAETQYFDASIQ